MRKKALVVDDNANNLMLEKDLLEVAGFELFEAENAADGIAIARKMQKIISNLLTPINGISALTKLLSARKMQKIISNLLIC